LFTSFCFYFTLLFRLSGLEPFPSPKGGDAGTYSNVVRCDFEFIKPFFNKISLNAQDFISTILKVNPNDRASISSCFEHPWLKGDAARMEPMVGVGQRLAESLMKKRESVSSNLLDQAQHQFLKRRNKI